MFLKKIDVFIFLFSRIFISVFQLQRMQYVFIVYKKTGAHQ